MNKYILKITKKKTKTSIEIVISIWTKLNSELRNEIKSAVIVMKVEKQNALCEITICCSVQVEG